MDESQTLDSIPNLYIKLAFLDHLELDHYSIFSKMVAMEDKWTS